MQQRGSTGDGLLEKTVSEEEEEEGEGMKNDEIWQ